MSHIQTKTPKVLLALEMANAAGRQQLIGIFRFLAQSVRWDIKIVQPPTELTEDAIEEALCEKFDGIITALPCTAAASQRLAQTDIPVVMLDISYPMPTNKKVKIIRIDDMDIASQAANYFLNMGKFNDYAFVHAPNNPDWSLKREKGFKKTLASSKHKLRVFRHKITKSETDLIQWLHSLHKPTAILCANDTCAIHVLNACHDANINVPSCISILGIDDDEYLCGSTRPPISSVRPDFESEGFQAAKTLSKMMSGQTLSKANTKIMTSCITERSSTCRLPPAAALVNRGLEFIRLNAKRNITVSAVVAHLGVSRRLADLRFRQIENKSILEAITECRLKIVKHNLSETKASIATITRSCGFPSANYLKELFRKHCGMTMREWRVKHNNRTNH